MYNSNFYFRTTLNSNPKTTQEPLKPLYKFTITYSQFVSTNINQYIKTLSI